MKLLTRAGGVILLLLAIGGLVFLGIWIGHGNPAIDRNRLFLWSAVTFTFGLLVGLSEILSRYRDEPLLAATTAAGTAYALLNGAISLAAFAVIRRYPKQIFSGLENDLFLTAIVAGFGAMAVFRSKLFTFRTPDGKEIPIGPSIVLDSILRTIDNKIDRKRATERQEQVFRSMLPLHDFANISKYVLASLNSFQNLSDTDKSDIKQVIDDYSKRNEWPDTLKSLGLGFAFLNIAGEENYDEVMRNINDFVKDEKDRNKSAPVPPPPAPGGNG